MRIHRVLLSFVAGLILLAESACAGPPAASSSAMASGSASSAHSITLTNCGLILTYEKVPTRGVTLNSGATEVILALGQQSHLAGTAYLDNPVPEKWQGAYQSVPVLSKKYPSKEQLLAATPDFAYASYSSAFTDKAVGTREELAKEGISTYLSPFGCPKGVARPTVTFDSVWSEMSDIGKIFGAEHQATAVINGQKKLLAAIQSASLAKGRTALWFDSGDKTPFVGAGQGGPELILQAVGATNIFADLPNGWADGSWEKVVAAHPDFIVLADADWSTAQSKIAYLEADPVLSQLDAVKHKRFVTVAFSQSSPGAELVDGAKSVSDQLATLLAK